MILSVGLLFCECLEDKIVNHLVSYKILSKLDKYMIDSNCATRKGRGTSYARKLLDRYLCEIKNKYNTFYILKFDITKYFYSIDHSVLLDKLAKYLSSYELFEVKKILGTTNHDYILNSDLGYSYGKGLSIGNMTSQILAIFYLNDLDHFIKENLACKYYIKYMDDGIILSHDKNKLRDIKKILENKLSLEYKLELNSKTKIYKSTEGFTFLGFRYKVINNRIIRNIPSVKKNNIRRNLCVDNYSSYLSILKYVKIY